MDPHTPIAVVSPELAAPKESSERKKFINLEAILESFEVEPEDYETAWKEVKACLEQTSIPRRVPTLAPSSLADVAEALRLFGLRETEAPRTLFDDLRITKSPTYLEESIQRIHAVTNGGRGKNSEAFSRTVLDQILICCLFEEGQEGLQHAKHDERIGGIAHSHPPTPYEDPAKLELVHETPLSRVVTYHGEQRQLTGFADYSVWYDSTKKRSMATNLVIIEAKRRYLTDSALPQLAAYMGIVYSTRKQELKRNRGVYGISSDGRTYRFCRIDDEGQFMTSKLLEWESGGQDQIYSIIRSLLRTAALSSPSTTPIKDPMKREIVLRTFGSLQQSNQFDYGLGAFEVFYEDEIDKDNCDIYASLEKKEAHQQ